jgi:mannosyl-glycoprotein endo-beta-N-acetylglucosaminidase
MLKELQIHVKELIFSKRLFLTILIVLSSIGSYTYSEITPHSITYTKSTKPVINLLKSFNNFSAYYISTVAKTELNLKSVKKSPSEFIMDDGSINAKVLADFLSVHNKSIDSTYANKLAQLYVVEAVHEGVNPELAFTQMCLETGFLRYNGTVDKEQNNFCGLGATGNGVKGLSFFNPQEGVRAHIQHLKAYGSTKELNNELVDSRFKYVKRGCVTNLSGLTGKWATDKKYDIKIRSLLKRLYSFSQDEEATGS